MSPAVDLLLRAARAGIRFHVQADETLRLVGPPRPPDPQLVDEIRDQKAVILGLLTDPGRAARDAWAKAVEEISARWDEAFGGAEDPPWLDEAVDAELQARVREGILSEDLPEALEAIDCWRSAWSALISTAVRSAPPTKPVSDAEPKVEIREAVPLTSNASVHEMFSEARARLVSRDLEERSLTVWLRRHAPAVAALWPEAPVEASWFAWRCAVGPEHVAVLDQAWHAVTDTAPSRTDGSRDGGEA